jgi:hypothetical protein
MSSLLLHRGSIALRGAGLLVSFGKDFYFGGSTIVMFNNFQHGF